MEEVARGPLEAAGAWHMVEDDLTGTLVITATPAQHEEVERVLARLESEPADSRIALRAFPIRHRDVDEFLGLLENLLQGKPLPAATTEGTRGAWARASGLHSLRPPPPAAPVAGRSPRRATSRSRRIPARTASSPWARRGSSPSSAG